MFGLLNNSDVPKEGRHWELHQSNRKKNQAAVLKVVSAIWSFTNPQRVPVKSRLYSLVSGSLVNKDVANDILNSSVWFGVDIFFCF